MIFPGSVLRVIDNSGARVVRCIRVLGNAGLVARPGASIIVSVRRINPKKRIKKGEVHRAVLVSSKKEVVRSNGISVKFGANCAIVVNSKGVPLGTRILGPVMLEVRQAGFVKIVSMATVSI